ncbi:casein kinase, partial [Fomitiporia mediterranea MF3/22]|uniref:casein kinase n=1 Tax=Fomitiporia mediterranea (strain MF3/22) TaxID=694068 RepID=UPI0004408CE5
MNRKSHALGLYKNGKRIASGGFGFVHSGKTPDGKKVAIKYERTNNRITRPYLEHEANVYRLLEGHPCVPKVYAYGREAPWNIMVFDLLGTSLETLFEKCKSKFSFKTTFMLAPQIIDCIQYCHSKGIIHRDIKPDNFLMGRDDRANFVHIIDFGLARRYKNPKSGQHFPYFEGHNFFGTTRYASLKALEGCSQSRRDDLESAAYSLIYYMRGRLPWQGLRGGTDKHRDQRVREKKRTWTPERLCEGLPEELAKMLAYIKTLEYEDEPDYEYLKKLFTDRFKKEGFELDYDYDW